MSDDDPSAVVERAVAAGVSWMVNPGTDARSSQASAALAGQFPDVVLYAAGLHPHDADRWNDERTEIERLAGDAVAVGECGLDFYRNLAPREAQLTAFRDQLRLASELDKPIIVHCRDAFTEVYDELVAAGHDRVVLHCWTGGPKWTKRFAELGVTFSFAGPVSFAGGDTVRRAAAVAPRDRVMVETDTPFLTPPPDRALPNEPANVVRVGAALADVWGEAPDAVAAITTAEAERVFRG
jgi:TatD DNase family protein